MSRDKGQTNKGSMLLTHDENLKVFSLLESKCLSLSSAIVQLYATEAPTHSFWTKKGTGVLCLIRDSHKRSYFLRLYCTLKDCLLWEHELYANIEFNRVRPFFITFEGHESTIGINFASQDEAQEFYDNVVQYAYRMSIRKKRRQPSEEEYVQDNLPPPAAILQDNLYEEIPAVTLRKPDQPPEPPQNFNSLFGPDRSRVQRKVGVNKNNIGSPSNFVHVAHIGFDQDRGFDTRGETQIINQFLKKAGVYDAYTTDRETKAFIDDFMQQNNVIDEIKSEYDHEPINNNHNTNTLRHNKHNKFGPKAQASPRPPPRQGPPMPSIPAPILPESERYERKPSKPSSGGGGGPVPPPPPPPPPPMMDQPRPPPPPSQQQKLPMQQQDDPRSALLDSIRKGAQLKKSTETDNNRGSMNPPVDNNSSTKTDMLASALIRAITERRQHMVHSDNSDDDEKHNNDDDWE